MFALLRKRLIAENQEHEYFTSVLQLCTDEPRPACIALAKKIPAIWRGAVVEATCRGMSLADCDKIFTCTFASASWQLRWSVSDVNRVILGIPTIREMS